jgi:plasmid stabilization system protein ParE
MKDVEVTDDARADIDRIRSYLEAQRRGYGETFDDTVESTLARICLNPGIFGTYALVFRKCRMNRFSYYVYFRELPDRILIMRIIHTRRDQDTAFGQKPKPKKPKTRAGS